MVIFLIATLGFTIYSHHCNSSGQTYSSLFEDSIEDADPCHHESKAVQTCCSVSSSCETPEIESECCSNFELFIRADIVLNVPSDNSENIVSDIMLFESDFELFDENELNNKVNDTKGYSLPPPKSGADLILFLNHQKISPEHIS